MIAAHIAGGQRNDAPLAPPVLAEAVGVTGRVDEVLGDKGFDSDKIRETILEEHDALPVIPNKKNRVDPHVFDEEMKETYKRRNRVERAFAKAKQFRRFATRYEKLGEVYLAVIRLVFGLIQVKKKAGISNKKKSESVNTP